MDGLITHLMRAPVVGGSELETLSITRTLRGFRHRVVFPERFAGLGPSIQRQFPADVEVTAVPDLEAEWRLRPPRLLHIQFPFIIEPRPRGLDSVLELRKLPDVATVFTVHAAVNVPVVPEIHYLFHTERLHHRFQDRIPRERVTICGSLVAPPSRQPQAPRADDRVVILWVSRNEDAKFHPEVASVCRAVLDACPQASFRFVGRPEAVRLPDDPRVSVIPAPAPDLEAEYRNADLFWAFPHPLLEETWCRTLTEALGHGLPAVVAAHGALSDQVQHGRHGLVVDSPMACAGALVELVRSSRSRSAMGRSAAVRARELYLQTVVQLESLYHRMLSERSVHAESA